MIILFTIVLICLIISIYVLMLWLLSLSSRPSLALNWFDLRLKDSKIQNIVRITIDSNVRSTPTNASCHYFNCFDVYRCGNYDHDIDSNEELIGVYIYPPIDFVDTNGNSILSPISRQFRQLLEAVADSPYYTSDPSKACLFVPNIDLLDLISIRVDQTSKVLASLPYWDSKGANHLIFSMIAAQNHYQDNSIPGPDFGDALIAGAGLDIWSHRPTFDVSIPFYSLFSEDKEYDRQTVLDRTRKRLVVCALYDAVSDDNQQILKDLKSSNSDRMLVLRHHCNQVNANETEMCDIATNEVYSYPNVLTESTFCLILETLYLGHPVLSDSLMMGCIPVVVSDNYLLPFEEKLDWERTSVRIWSHSLPDLIGILENIPEERVSELREQSVFIWSQYFRSMKVIALTTLKIINERVFPNSASSSSEWNGPPKPSINNEYAIINPKLSSRQSIGFTAVILTYDRLESLYEVIRSVVRARSCVKVLVIWNNQVKSPPTPDHWPNIHLPLEVVITTANKLSNRFYPFEAIETEAILAIDDDIVMLTPDELEFGYQAWREFPDRIVGFPSRVHRWDNATHKWKYESEWTNDVSMVLTGAAFYHKVSPLFLDCHFYFLAHLFL